VSIVFLLCFVAGILLGVRLLFFGAERRRLKAGAIPLRRSEPAVVAFLTMFGLAGYLLDRSGHFTSARTATYALLLAAVWAFIVTRLAIATARIVPEVDPDDPRFALQGCVAVVTKEIPADQEGEIRFESESTSQSLRARNIGEGGISAGDEVCIERVDDGIAFVERWSLVEKRL
jgi:membrane protein implicated in regulation of membrane protease activity